MDSQEQENKNWLKEIAQRSWEPELLVSGAAIYLTSSLPTWIDSFYNYYVVDVLADRSSASANLPILSISFLNLIAYVLLVAFITHFAMRAFWVAIVGLTSVFPQDINYQNLPRYSDSFKEKIKDYLGSLQDYVVKLDKLCSALLSLAFLIAMILTGACGAYMLIFMLLGFLGLLIPNFEAYEDLFYYLILSVLIIPAIIGSLATIPSLKNKPFIANLHFKTYTIFSRLMFLFLSKPLQRVSFIFISNISRKTYYLAITFFSVAMIVLMPFAFKSKVMERITQTRIFYSRDTPLYYIENDYYENLMNTNSPIIRAVIPSDVIKGNSLKVFISYPKRFDRELKKICQEPAQLDTLNKEEKRKSTDQYYLACLSKFFTISINDSLYKEEFLFTKHHITKELGLVVYLPTYNFNVGKNILKIQRNYADSTKRKQGEDIIPFWFEGKNN